MRLQIHFGLLCGLAVLGCSHRPEGRLQYQEVHSEAEGRQMGYGVYLPPGWDGKRPLPLVVLLHGAGDDETSADREAVTKTLDGWIERNWLPPFVMVTPQGDRGFWVNWYDDNHHFEDWVLEEVVPRMYAQYALIPAPEGLHLMGVSMGGGGGLQMWLRHPERFASVTLLSTPILDEQDTRAFLRRFVPGKGIDAVFGPPGASVGRDPYQVLREPRDRHGTQLFIGAARHDLGAVRSSTRAFHEHLQDHGVAHHFAVFPGRHNWNGWARVFPVALCKHLREDCELSLRRGWSLHEPHERPLR